MALVGPTAAGKSSVALEVAGRTGAVVLSVDSMQVYRHMDIGTAKPTSQERADVTHLMIDLVEPEEDYTVAQFQQDARAAVAEVDAPVLVVGGSGLHFRAVIDPLEFPPTDPSVRREIDAMPDEAIVEELRRADPGVERVIDVRNRRRTARAVEILRITGLTPTARLTSPAADRVRAYRSSLPVTVFGLDGTESTAGRVRSRVGEMRRLGLLSEVAGLRGRMGSRAGQAVGYKELIPVVDGVLDADAGFEQVVRSTMNLVKRQRTYFRRDPRIRWFDGPDHGLTGELVSQIQRAVSR